MAIKHLVWLRNDLRWRDNPALYYASLSGSIRVLVSATPEQWQEHNESNAKTGLRAGLIQRLFEQLATLGIPAEVICAPRFEDLPSAMEDYCLMHGIEHIWFNQELPIDEQQRDQMVCQQLKSKGIENHPQATDLLVSQPVLSQQSTPFKVFTPFFKRWLSLLSVQDWQPLPEPEKQADAISFKAPEMPWIQPYREDLWTPDQEVAKQKLWHFCHTKEADYETQRNYPIDPATSTLSPYLALGALGPRECIFAIMYACEQAGRRWQESVWLKELAWRDFYRQLMGHFPFLAMGKPFKAETDFIQWNQEETLFNAWTQGNTGFPIVDAAMRQLNQTGWMHNRLRMISASFLSKLVFADWRKGEEYFMRHLIDGEFSANNGGWQWSASTGCDAAPYFRVFNPTRQSETYDANGDFIRRFVPELAELDARSIHNPSASQRAQCHYPLPILDYRTSRLAAIQAFADLKEIKMQG
ncbi:cryptochrome/photolyase family protein [Marinomonas pollencensis]|uniref:Deoxyribodipyrimidine photo-lyase n=1 Tax=Marinomonas pollencensis TaxID=491954 RepID=A0A3E0DY16_9GAMM|nr:FAD-binding domain-containing protein [Marinomonas pollencensis]REG86981.1 deoxyribodipyrimidine photo-lyase [Marinomonas pollencensis]